GADFTTATNSMSYDAQGRFITGETNALGHISSRSYHPVSGQISASTDSNGLTTQYSYDGLGQIAQRINPDGVKTTTSYSWCTTGCPVDAMYTVTEFTDGSAPAVTYHNELGMEVRSSRVGLDGRAIYIDRQYNALGQNTHVSEPYFAAESVYWTITDFDALGRAVLTTHPDGSTGSVDYNGLMVSSTNALGQTNLIVKDVMGHQVLVFDDAGGYITSTFDGFGQLLKTQD
ncbi:MAG: RHS repeat protein, partial [Psychrosphaera sp.]|nr:RHS repeat protein [Psychrosphaera sp.]